MKKRYLTIGFLGLLGLVKLIQHISPKQPDPIIISDSTQFSEAVFLTTDNLGNPIITWSSAPTDSSQYQLAFSRMDKETLSVSEEKKVEKTTGMQVHHESMAKIGVKDNGDMLAIYRRVNPNSKRRFAGDIYYLESTDDGVTWSQEKKLVTDTTSSSQGFYDIARLANGELGVTWLDSRKIEQKDGSSFFFNQTKAEGGFAKEKGLLGSTCQCCRTELQVDMYGKINIALRDIINDSIRDMVYISSIDNGKSFSKAKRISEDNWVINGCPHTGPTIATNSTKRAVSWFTLGGSQGVYFTVGQQELNTSPKRILINEEATHPQMVWSGDYFALAYDLKVYHNGKPSRQVVVSFLDNDGNIKETIKVSPVGENSTMPVIQQINNEKLLVAWVNHKNDQQSAIKARVIDGSI